MVRRVVSSKQARQYAALRSAIVEVVESRVLFVASFDVSQLTQLRADPEFVDVDGSDVAIAVLDSGIFATNPDLRPNVVAWYNAVADPVSTPLTTTPVTDAFDLQGHGSHVSGIAASSDPDIGVAYAAKLVSVKVLPDPGESQLSGNPLLRGLQWVKLHASALDIRVVNMSLSTGENFNEVSAEIAGGEMARAIDDLEALGITVVASSGNSYAEFQSLGVGLPAAVSTINVANAWANNGRSEDFNSGRGGSGDRYQAIETTAVPDRLAAASQRSTLPNQLVAPGQSILSTWNGIGDDQGADGLRKIQSGSSMAAPFVSGAVALMQDAAQLFGGRYLSDPNQILDILQSTADNVFDSAVADNNRYDTITGDLTDLPETGLQFKRINIYKAVQAVVDLVTEGNPNVPPPPGGAADTDSVRSRATLVPALDGTQQFSFSRAIGVDGQVAVGNADVDLFRIELETRGSVNVALTPPEGTAGLFSPVIRLFNAAGTQIARADGVSAAFPLLATSGDTPLTTGIYYVGISGLANVGYNIVSGVGAQAAAAVGDYQMTVTLSNPDPDGVVAGATAVDLTDPGESAVDPLGSGRTISRNRLSGVLGSDKPRFGDATRVAVDADVDMYRVVAPDTGKLVIRTESESLYSSDGADTYLKVYDDALALVGENDDLDGSTIDSGLTLDVERGATYWVAVTVFGNRSFDANDPYNSRTTASTPTDRPYDLVMWVQNGDIDGTVQSATVLAPGAAANGAIGADAGAVGFPTVGGDALPNKDVDWYRLTAPSVGVLGLNFTTVSGAQPEFSLWSVDEANRQVTRIDDASAGVQTDTAVALRVTQGQVIYVAVAGAGNHTFNGFGIASGAGGQTGVYTLTTTLQSESVLKQLTNDSLNTGTPTPIALGQTIAAAIGRDDTFLAGASDVDVYTFTAPADMGVRFRTIAAGEEDADTVLRLFDSAGNELASNDNASATGKASRIADFLTAGQTYFVGVSGAGTGATAYNVVTGAGAAPGSTGRYSLVVEPLPPGSASLTFGGDDIGTYTDALGNTVTLRLKGPGVGQLEVDSSDPDSFLLTVTGSAEQTSFIITGVSTFGNISIDGPLKAFDADDITLRGDLDIGGAVKKFSLAAALPGSSVSADAVTTLRVGGAFGADLSVPGGLGTMTVLGDLTDGDWAVGSAGKIRAGNAASGFDAAFAGEVRSLTLASLSGKLTAGSLRSVQIAGALQGASVRSAGDITKLVVGSAIDSQVFAGVGDGVTGLPTDAADFSADSAVRSFVVRTGGYDGTDLAASQLRKVRIKGVQGNNDGDAFGLSATTYGSVIVDGQRLTKPNQGPVVGAPIDDFQLVMVPTA